MRNKRETIFARLPRMINEWRRTNPDGCWEWPFAKVSGYGVFTRHCVMYRAHRAIYEMLVAPVPDHLVMDHLCRNRACVNPKHLEPVTDWVNCVERGHTTTAANHRKTRCLRGGHPLAGDNLYITPSGGRSCRACATELRRARTGYKGNVPGGQRTHCKHGHALAGDNLRLNKRGTYVERVCRTCLNQRQRECRQRQKAHALAA